MVEVVVGVGLIHDEDEDAEDAEDAEEDSKEYQGFNLMSKERERERERERKISLKHCKRYSFRLPGTKARRTQTSVAERGGADS